MPSWVFVLDRFYGVVSVAMSTITCENGQVYVAVTKKCTSYASEESYKILNGADVVVTSQPFANNEERTDEYCLPAATNSQQNGNAKLSNG